MQLQSMMLHLETGMIPLRDYGIQKVIEGFTTLDEILRVC
jgi:type II secretory ATPase GspE/PulE/Tfp pilus assembly ATPase PilB-like protein